MIGEDRLDPALAETAAEVAGALAGRRLLPGQRGELYTRALAMAERRSVLAPWRRLGGKRWLPAALGGAVIAAVAGAAIGVAMTRGRRQQHAVAA